MEFGSLFQMQGMLFLIVLAGAVLRKAGVVDDAGKRCLTDVTIDIIIPCNIIRSFMIDLDWSVLKSCALLFGVALGGQILCLVLNRFLWNRYGGEQKKILQYTTICSNGGFLGNAVAEGVYGSMGLMYASVFLIPMRVVLWSAGVTYFTVSPDRKTLVKKVLTHPCIVAVFIGLVLMLGQIHLPAVLSSTIQSIGGCNTAMTMLLIGTILADADWKTVISKTSIYYTVIRLFALPALTLLACRLVNLNDVATGIAVLMMGMPAGSTSAIFAARYGSDAEFATKLVVLTTLLSLVTIPLWCLFL